MKRFAAAGWHVLAVDGHDADAVARAIRKARRRHRQALADRLQDGDRLRRADQGRHRGNPRLAAGRGRDRRRARRSSAGSHAPFDIPEAIFSAWRKIGSARQVGPTQVGEAAGNSGARGTQRIRPPPARRHSRRGRRGDRRLQGQGRDRQARLGHAQVEPGSAGSHQPGAARHDRRLGRSHRLEQHQDRDAEAVQPRQRLAAATSITASASTRWPRP